MIKHVFAITGALLLFAVILISAASAISVTSVTAETLAPGTEGVIRVEIENIFQDTVEDVTFSLNLENLPFIPIGSSSEGFDELEENDDGRFSFRIRAANDIAPGDYQIPYTIDYSIDGERRERTGSIGVSVKAQPELSFSIETENPVIGTEGKVTLKIVNRGFADARFVSVKALPQGLTLLSESDVYIGTVDSDDFETAVFNVIFNSQKADFSAIVQYTDFENNKITKTVDIPITVYSQEKAIELGIIEESNLGLYIGIVVAIIIIWLVWRWVAKRRRMKKSLQR